MRILIYCVFLFSVLFSYGQAYIRDGKGQLLAVEIADTPYKQEKGLMHRLYLAPWQGMLFIFPEERYSNFWMKNTLLDLDIRFYTKDFKLTARYPNAKPCLSASCPLYPSLAPVKYVLELRGQNKYTSKIMGFYLLDDL